MRTTGIIVAGMLALWLVACSGGNAGQQGTVVNPGEPPSEEDVEAQIDALIDEIESGTEQLNETFEAFYSEPGLEAMEGLITRVEETTAGMGVAHNRLLLLDEEEGFRLQVLYSKGELFQLLSEDLGNIPLPREASEEELVALEERLAGIMFEYDELALSSYLEILELAELSGSEAQEVDLARSAVEVLENRIAEATVPEEEEQPTEEAPPTLPSDAVDPAEEDEGWLTPAAGEPAETPGEDEDEGWLSP